MNNNNQYIVELKKREAEAKYQYRQMMNKIEEMNSKSDLQFLEEMDFAIIEKFVRDKKLKNIKK